VAKAREAARSTTKNTKITKKDTKRKAEKEYYDDFLLLDITAFFLVSFLLVILVFLVVDLPFDSVTTHAAISTKMATGIRLPDCQAAKGNSQ
jgi:hypothetical protein